MTEMPRTSRTRVVIVGAGWTGLATAKTYLQIRPNVDLTIVDEDSSVGGVWSASRVYPGLIADSTAAIFDYSDFPMDVELGLDKWADLPAEKVHEYLERYVDKFDLRRRCRLNTRVTRITRLDESGSSATWNVELESKSGVVKTLVCDKLIIATGLDSTPSYPTGINWSSFDGHIMHSKDVGTRHDVLTSEKVKRVAVVGGNKSAVDVVNLCALAGKEVDWIIREEGYGPGVLFEARSNGIHVGVIKAARASGILSPNMFNKSGFWYWFLHSGKSRVGSWLLKSLLDKISDSAMSAYDRNENTLKIQPDLKDLFWINSGLSVTHDGSTFMDSVADGKLIHIHRASVSSLTKGRIHFSDGRMLPCDTAVFATGWQLSQTRVCDPKLHPDIGFPQLVEHQDPKDAYHWKELVDTSESEIRKLFPMLAHPPANIVAYDKKHAPPARTTPFRLFRNIVPPKLAAKNDRSLIVLGLLVNTSVPTYAEVSSLWGIAYLENMPFSPSTARIFTNVPEMERDISALQAYSDLRYRNPAAHTLDGSECIQDFTDLLMRDLGLVAERKRHAVREKWVGARIVGWWEEWFTPYRGLDYAGFVDEYLELWGLNTLASDRHD